MVNASLNWASIVGIVLAVCGAGLYFMRSFKPALARDYDVFFAAIGLLCGGILFFQGWRLDPILQFGQFLLAGTTVFFAYESVRLRGVAADQARRSSYFDDEPSQPSGMPSGRNSGSWDDSFDQFDTSAPLRRRFSSQDDVAAYNQDEDLYRPRRTSRAAIPEQAASRRRRSRNADSSWNQNEEQVRRMKRFDTKDEELEPPSNFGQRRNLREEQRRGSRPSVNEQTARRRSSRETDPNSLKNTNLSSPAKPGVPKGAPFRSSAEDASFSPSRSRRASRLEDTSSRSGGTGRSFSSDRPTNSPAQRRSKPRDNSSRFDD